MNKNLKAILVTAGVIVLGYGVKTLSKSILINNEHVTWTPEFTKSIYNSTYNGLGGMFTDSDERKIADCIVNKLKNKYPKGFDGRNNDSVEKQTELLSEDCLKGMVLHFTWSERFINKVQQNARKASWLKLVSEKDKDKYCTCYINRLKQMHPNGIVDSLRQADVDSAFDFCKQGIVKR